MSDLWRTIDEAMNYEHRINGWWLFVIFQVAFFLGLLVGWVSL